jgi:hypothetical protein
MRPEPTKSSMDLNEDDLNRMELAVLFDLLSAKTIELLENHQVKNADGTKIRDLKLVVERIQKVIKAKTLDRGKSRNG